MRVVPVRLGRRRYSIRIVRAGLTGLVPYLQGKYAGRRVALFTDRKVMRLYGRRIFSELEAGGFRPTAIEIAGGERSKTPASVARAWVDLMSAGFGRSDTIIVALGGGVVGDVAGFVAATYMRGVDFIQVPTTLLAQVDSSVGGKTGVNLPGAKNAVGAFYQPRLVYSGLQTLRTLTPRDYRAGLGEVIKHGVLGDTKIIDRVLSDSVAVADREPHVLEDLVADCCVVKRDVVELDEREAGLRQILNFGHSFGHAIEVATKHRIRHGEAVGLGMISACRVSEHLGLCARDVRDTLVEVMSRVGMDTNDAPYWRHDIVDLIARDKKMRGSELGFIAVRRLGDVFVRPLAFLELKKIVKSSTCN